MLGGCFALALAACAMPEHTSQTASQAFDQAWDQIGTAASIAVAADRREFQKAALEIGAFLKNYYPEVRADTRACERAINRGDRKTLQNVCELDPGYVNETPVELTNIAMGRMALGQYLSSATAVGTLQAVRPTDGAARLAHALMPDLPGPVFATRDDLARGGPFVIEHMAAFDRAVSTAEAGNWQGSCAELDRAIPTLPDFRSIHLLRFVICGRAGADRSIALAQYGAMADPETRVLVGLLLREFPAAELLTRLKATSAFADAYVERHYYAAEIAYLSGDGATYRKELALVTRAKDSGLFEQRLAAAEASAN